MAPCAAEIPPLATAARRCGRTCQLQAHIGGQFFGVQPEPARHVHENLGAQRNVGHLQHQRLQLGLHACTPLRGGDVAPAGQLLEQEGRQRQRIAHQRLESLQPFLAHEAVGVVLGRQEQKIQLLGVGQHRQCVLQRTPCRTATGAVTVEGKDDAVGLAQQLGDVHGRRGRTQRGHGIGAAVLVQHHHVHVPFHHQHPAGFANALARLVQAVEFVALGKQRAFGGVQVLGFTSPHHATTKADDLPARVADGKHHPLAEAVVAPAFVTGNHQPGPLGVFRGIVGQHPLEVAPAGRGIAQPEALGRLAAHAPVLQVLDGRRGFLQPQAVVGGGPVHPLRQRQLLTGLLGGITPLAGVVFGHGQPGVAGQFVHGLDEAHAEVLHQEVDGRAMGAAAETVVKLLGGRDGKGRRLFVVKRTQPLVIGTRLLQFDRPTHHIDDVDAGQQLLNERLRDQTFMGRRVCARRARSGGQPGTDPGGHGSEIGLACQPGLDDGHHLAHVGHAGGAGFCHGGLDDGADLRLVGLGGTVGVEHGQFGALLFGQFGTAGLFELLDRVSPLLGEFLDDGKHLGVVERDALIDFLLLDGDQQQPQCTQTHLLARPHGRLHVGIDTRFEISSCIHGAIHGLFRNPCSEEYENDRERHGCHTPAQPSRTCTGTQQPVSKKTEPGG